MTNAAPLTDDDITSLADKLLDRLTERPEILDAIADRLTERMTQPATAADNTPNARSPLDGPHETAAREVVDIVREMRPTLVQNDPLVWARGIVIASGRADPRQVLKWALAKTCPTPFFREIPDAISPPKQGRRKTHGFYTQMVAEYAATQQVPDASSRIDKVVETTLREIKKHTGIDSDQLQPRARKNAQDILGKAEWHTEHVISVISWGLATRPHWRNSITGVPAVPTYKKIHGDWVKAGNSVPDAPTEIRDQAEMLAEGWRHYYSQRMDSRTVQLSTATHANLTQCLIGSDGADPINVETLKMFIKWLCDSENQQVTYLLDGRHDFPPIAKVRRGLLAMTTPDRRRRTTVTTTNDNAAAGISYGPTVSEV